MAFANSFIAALMLAIFLEAYVNCGDSSGSGSDDSSNIPILASGKRQHNIMRFGKRPAGGHSLIHFGKREDGSKPLQHSFLYFGKRDNDPMALPDLFQYLQKNRDNSYKRGHSIMRFGKRGQGSHSFIRFGKRDDDDAEYDGNYPDEDEQDLDDEEKRSGHSMMYFGKRGGHSMMYFGKRAGHNMLSFGKRDDDKRAHSMIHFGKRDEYDEDDFPYEDKRAHSMIHFGKRDYSDMDPEEVKRGSHSMIHFGKRNYDEAVPFYWDPAMSEKRQHNLLRFGKKTEGARKGSHAMIHFGKRGEDSDDKRAHAMIHFGKRSVDEGIETVASGNQSDKDTHADGKDKGIRRMKRETDPASDHPIVSVVGYEPIEDVDEELFGEDFQNAIRGMAGGIYNPDEIYGSMPYPIEGQEFLAGISEYKQPDKKEGSKNVFLRFG